MANNSWQEIKKPILALAPMAGFTDRAFRQICKQFGVNVCYSEMASVSALYCQPKKTLELIRFNKIESPYIIQLFGKNPLHFAKAVQIITKNIKPDGIDINFGCPAKKIFKEGSGVALMDDPELSRQIIKSVCFNTNLPVSIKIRSKGKKITANYFVKKIAGLPIKAIMIHGRSYSQGFSGKIDTKIIKKIKKIYSGIILANGGINSLADAQEILKKTGADGIGIARGAIGRPWIFKEIKDQKEEPKNIDLAFKIALRHLKLCQKHKGEHGVIEARKHLAYYIKGLPNIKKIREKLTQIKTIGDLEGIIIETKKEKAEQQG